MDQDHTTHFIADRKGVSTVAVSDGVFIRGGRLSLDLEQYDLLNGRTLVLFTYNTYFAQNTGFSEIQLTEGWSGTVVYDYTTSSGQKAVAITELKNKGAYVDIPEPKTYGLLLASFSAFAAFAKRRRRHIK